MSLSLEDRLELLALPGRYGDIIDDKAWQKLDQIFVPNATFGSPDVPNLLGLEAIQRFMAHPKTAHPGAHMMCNIYIDETANGIQLNTRAMFPEPVDLTEGDTPSLVRFGSYYDTVVKTGMGWRVIKRMFSRTRLPR